jgi:hypothetical protein
MGALLVICGLTAAVIGCWRSYILARSALVPLVQDAEAQLGRETTSPQLGSQVRQFAWHLLLSITWMLVAFYGCFLAARGWGMPA